MQADFGSPLPAAQWLEGSFLPSADGVMRGVTLARTFRVLDSLVLAALVYMGALCFKKVTAVEHNQLAYCIQVRMQHSPQDASGACTALGARPRWHQVSVAVLHAQLWDSAWIVSGHSARSHHARSADTLQRSTLTMPMLHALLEDSP